jgi:hypothetical protein
MLLRHAPLPLYQMLLIDIFAPPIGTGIWWLMVRGLRSNLGTSDDVAVEGWTKSIGRFILIAAYAIFFGVTIYAYWINPYKGPPGR